jgi:hypothetical protein
METIIYVILTVLGLAVSAFLGSFLRGATMQKVLKLVWQLCLSLNDGTLTEAENKELARQITSLLGGKVSDPN